MNHSCTPGCLHEDEAIARSRQAGMRITEGVKAVIAFLHADRSLHSAAAIHAHLRAKGLTAGLPTVYRVCDNLVDAQVLMRQFASDGSQLYAMCLRQGSHHHHFICTQCGAILELDGCPLDGWCDAVAQKMGVKVDGHSLQLTGLCPQCRLRANAPN